MTPLTENKGLSPSIQIKFAVGIILIFEFIYFWPIITRNALASSHCVFVLLA
jgi:hypothetical protein